MIKIQDQLLLLHFACFTFSCVFVMYMVYTAYISNAGCRLQTRRKNRQRIRGFMTFHKYDNWKRLLGKWNRKNRNGATTAATGTIYKAMFFMKQVI